MKVFYIACFILLVDVNFSHQYSAFSTSPGIGRPYAQGYDYSFQQQQMPHPTEDISYWDSLVKKQLSPTYPQQLTPTQPSQDVWYPEGSQIVGDSSSGFVATIFRYIITFLQNLIPAPIRFLLGWY